MKIPQRGEIKMTDERNAGVSKTLTDKWKKGELPEGWYWVEGSRAEGIYAYTAEYLNNMYRPRNGERIIEQVPSYEQWQQLKKWCEEFNALDVAKENTKLKELLKECRDKWVCYKPYDRDQLLKRIDKILADNQIQANTVACNKIQENE